jgi:membrane-associated phospholipid phosphatase
VATPHTLTASARTRPRSRTWLRWGAPGAYVLALSLYVALIGVPISRDMLLAWVAGALLAFSITDPRRFVRGLLLDWVPFAAILFLYDLLRGYADGLISRPHEWPQMQADQWLFGGTAPTVWLQDHLWHGPGALHWYDYASWGVYMTHFLATPVLAAVLWIVASPRFRRFVAMVVVLALAGFATYALFPAVPPWLASVHGTLEPTTRTIPEVWSTVHIANAYALFQTGSQYANDVAAMPSLHAAYALLVALYLAQLMPRRLRVLRPLFFLYPLAMGFTLVYGAEHYVVDILAGWLYAAVAFWAVDEVADRRAARRAARARERARAPDVAPAPVSA